MLAKSPKPSTISYALSGPYEVRLANGLTCPHCGHALRASDVGIHGHAVLMICRGCHRDVLIIGSDAS